MLTISIRDGRPAIDVKDRTLWAQDPRLTRAYAELGEETIGGLWQDTAEDFWRIIVPAIAEPYGYTEIYSAGRSGGWLVVHGLGFLDYLDADDPWSGAHDADDTAPIADGDEADSSATAAIIDRDRFLKFAAEIEKALDAAGESFVERVLSELAELDAARETCIVRGEN